MMDDLRLMLEQIDQDYPARTEQAGAVAGLTTMERTAKECAYQGTMSDEDDSDEESMTGEYVDCEDDDGCRSGLDGELDSSHCCTDDEEEDEENEGKLVATKSPGL